MPDCLQSALASNNSCQEDWDKSVVSEGDSSDSPPHPVSQSVSTIQNSVVFPAADDDNVTTHNPHSAGCNGVGLGQGKRTLSELLKLHAEKGTEYRLSLDEANCLGDVLGQWINASPSPHEGEDDFFKSHDDIDLPPRRVLLLNGGRPRGQSECMGSRPSSSAGFST